MKIVFDKLAQLEFDDASEYYEFEVPGLGTRFIEEVKRGIRRIREYPDAWSKEKNDLLKCAAKATHYVLLMSYQG